MYVFGFSFVPWQNLKNTAGKSARSVVKIYVVNVFGLNETWLWPDIKLKVELFGKMKRSGIIESARNELHLTHNKEGRIFLIFHITLIKCWKMVVLRRSIAPLETVLVSFRLSLPASSLCLFYGRIKDGSIEEDGNGQHLVVGGGSPDCKHWSVEIWDCSSQPPPLFGARLHRSPCYIIVPFSIVIFFVNIAAIIIFFFIITIFVMLSAYCSFIRN